MRATFPSAAVFFALSACSNPNVNSQDKLESCLLNLMLAEVFVGSRRTHMQAYPEEATAHFIPDPEYDQLTDDEFQAITFDIENTRIDFTSEHDLKMEMWHAQEADERNWHHLQVGTKSSDIVNAALTCADQASK